MDGEGRATTEDVEARFGSGLVTNTDVLMSRSGVAVKDSEVFGLELVIETLAVFFGIESVAIEVVTGGDVVIGGTVSDEALG